MAQKLWYFFNISNIETSKSISPSKFLFINYKKIHKSDILSLILARVYPLCMCVCVFFLGSGALKNLKAHRIYCTLYIFTKLKCFEIIKVKCNLVMTEIFLVKDLDFIFSHLWLLCFVFFLQ